MLLLLAYHADGIKHLLKRQIDTGAPLVQSNREKATIQRTIRPEDILTCINVLQNWAGRERETCLLESWLAGVEARGG